MRIPFLSLKLSALTAFAFLALVFLVGASPAPKPDGGAAPVAVASPVRVTRDFANAWGYTRLQTSLLEIERDRIVRELQRLDAEKHALLVEGKAKFAIDLDAGDSFDERTLEIKRK